MTRLPPHDLDAEHAIIGVALLNTATAQATELTANHFYSPHNQHIWAAILATQGQADAITLAAALHRQGLDGTPYQADTLTRHALQTPTISNAERYAAIIRDTAERRHIIRQAADLTDAAYDLPTEHLHAALEGFKTGITVTTGHQLTIINWAELWADDTDPEDWLIPPLIPRGRSVALYAPAKAGKSTILLAVIAAAAAGRPILGGLTVPPCNILYLDYEMTRADLLERLSLLGYGPTDDLSRLNYSLLPTLPPLDTAAGAAALTKHCLNLGIHCVAVDTFGRAVQGDENEADTIRSFYRHTGQALKAAGIAVIRTDHAGKDTAKGQRGSSAKNDDVDLVWQLSRTDNGVIIRRTHTRITWARETITIDQITLPDDTIDYRDRSGIPGWPEGTRELILTLEQLAVPATASARAASQALRDAGHKARNALIRAAQAARRNDIRLMGTQAFTNAQVRPDDSGRAPQADPLDDTGRAAGRGGAHPLKPLPHNGAHLGARWGAPPVEDAPSLRISKDTETGRARPAHEEHTETNNETDTPEYPF